MQQQTPSITALQRVALFPYFGSSIFVHLFKSLHRLKFLFSQPFVDSEASHFPFLPLSESKPSKCLSRSKLPPFLGLWPPQSLPMGTWVVSSPVAHTIKAMIRLSSTRRAPRLSLDGVVLSVWTMALWVLAYSQITARLLATRMPLPVRPWPKLQLVEPWSSSGLPVCGFYSPLSIIIEILTFPSGPDSHVGPVLDYLAKCR